MIDRIAFDADDTLWHNETLYRGTEKKLAKILKVYATEDVVTTQVLQKESANIELYGYGIKSFTLSMIETAIELSQAQISSDQINKIIELGKTMLTADVHLLDGVHATIKTLAQNHKLMLITKGDLRDQESKLQRSGLSTCFPYVEVVAEKVVQTYQTLFMKYEIEPERFLMIGNSLKSDILPVIACGASAVHIPYAITWAHEDVPEPPEDTEGYYRLDKIDQLPDLLRQISE